MTTKFVRVNPEVTPNIKEEEVLSTVNVDDSKEIEANILSEYTGYGLDKDIELEEGLDRLKGLEELQGLDELSVEEIDIDELGSFAEELFANATTEDSFNEMIESREMSDEDYEEFKNKMNSMIVRDKAFEWTIRDVNFYKWVDVFSKRGKMDRSILNEMSSQPGVEDTITMIKKHSQLIQPNDEYSVKRIKKIIAELDETDGKELKRIMDNAESEYKIFAGLSSNEFTLSQEQVDKVKEEMDTILKILSPSVETDKEEDILKYERQRAEEKYKETINNFKGLETIKNPKVIYNILNIYHITDKMVFSEARDYIEIEAVRVKILDKNLKIDELEKDYPEKLRMRIPHGTAGTKLAVYRLSSKAVVEKYNTWVEVFEKEVFGEGELYEKYKTSQPSNITVIKPFICKYKDSIISFTDIRKFTDFQEKTVNAINQLKDKRSTIAKDYAIGIEATPTTYPQVFRNKVLNTSISYETHTYAEILKMIESLKVEDYMKSALKLHKGIHKYDTPMRHIIQKSIEFCYQDVEEIQKVEREVRASLNMAELEMQTFITDADVVTAITVDDLVRHYVLKELFERKKVKISKMTLIETMKFIKNQISVIDKTFELGETVRIKRYIIVDMNSVQDLLIRNFNALEQIDYTKYTDDILESENMKEAMKEREEQDLRYISIRTLEDILKDDEAFSNISFEDIMGLDMGYSKDKQGILQIENLTKDLKPKKDKLYNSLIDSYKALSAFEIGNSDEVMRREALEMKENSIILNNIETEEEYEEYLGSILEKIATVEKIKLTTTTKNILIDKYKSLVYPIQGKNANTAIFYNEVPPTEVQGIIKDLEETLVNIDSLKDLLISKISIALMNENTNEDAIIDMTEDEDFYRLMGVENEGQLQSLRDSSLLKDMAIALPFTALDEMKADRIIINFLKQLAHKEIKVNDYEDGLLLRMIGIPTVTRNNNSTNRTITLETVRNKETLTVLDYVNSYIGKDMSITIQRDIMMLTKMLVKTNEMNIIPNKNKEDLKETEVNRIHRKLDNIIKSILMSSPLPTREVDGIKMNVISKYVEDAIDSIALAELDKNIMMNALSVSLVYNNRNRSKTFIEEKLQSKVLSGNQEEVEKQIEEVIDARHLTSILSSLILVPMNIRNETFVLSTNLTNNLLNNLEDKVEEYVNLKELDISRKKANAYYRMYLDKGDTYYRDLADLDYVSFELLTKEEMMDGKLGGDFSRASLLAKYDVSTEIIDVSEETDVISLILLLETVFPNIKDELPKPIVERIESSGVMTLTEDIMKLLRKDTKFNLNFKNYNG